VQALRDEPITIYGDGSQTRSLCYVSDLVNGLVRVAERRGARGEVINLGNPEEHTVREFAQIIREAAGSSSELTFVDYAVGDDPKQRQPDISRARRLLDWEPAVSLPDGLGRTIDYFRAELAVTATG
jgi:nucleoside-diphosphate-sugar epimerase